MDSLAIHYGASGGCFSGIGKKVGCVDQVRIEGEKALMMIKGGDTYQHGEGVRKRNS